MVGCVHDRVRGDSPVKVLLAASSESCVCVPA